MHTPVLKKEAIEYLDPKPHENFIDCTIGQGGHSLAILEKTAPDGKILGIDQDESQISNLEPQILKLELRRRLFLVCDNFSNLKNIVERLDFKPVAGIILDLGMSSWHLEESKKGFSFLRDEPLDMRYNSEIPNSKFQIQNLTAELIVNDWPEAEIEKILEEYGEEKFAKRIANEIIKVRKINKFDSAASAAKLKPIKTTFQLVEIIKRATPVWYQRKKIHFATRTFQALRIAANDELNNLRRVLPQTVDILESGGRLVVISFHSLEDRIVKNFLISREARNITQCLKENLKSQLEKNSLTRKKGHLKILTKKPVRPERGEIIDNPRSRSAKLRAAVKI